MNKKAKSWIIALSLTAFLVIIIAGIAFAKPSAQGPAACKDTIDNDGDGLIDWPNDPGCTSKNDQSELGTNECDDGVDNDGDDYIDTSDSGCVSAYGTDESNCGDSVCEGSETSLNCPADCGYPNSCSDSDGGINILNPGYTSGYFLEDPYTNYDFCLTNFTLVEMYCSGEYSYNTTIDCSGNFTVCSGGRCI
jgi:hypothetical protein